MINFRAHNSSFTNCLVCFIETLVRVFSSSKFMRAEIETNHHLSLAQRSKSSSGNDVKITVSSYLKWWQICGLSSPTVSCWSITDDFFSFGDFLSLLKWHISGALRLGPRLDIFSKNLSQVSLKAPVDGSKASQDPCIENFNPFNIVATRIT